MNSDWCENWRWKSEDNEDGEGTGVVIEGEGGEGRPKENVWFGIKLNIQPINVIHTISRLLWILTLRDYWVK